MILSYVDCRVFDTLSTQNNILLCSVFFSGWHKRGIIVVTASCPQESGNLIKKLVNSSHLNCVIRMFKRFMFIKGFATYFSIYFKGIFEAHVQFFCFHNFLIHSGSQLNSIHHQAQMTRVLNFIISSNWIKTTIAFWLESLLERLVPVDIGEVPNSMKDFWFAKEW